MSNAKAYRTIPPKAKAEEVAAATSALPPRIPHTLTTEILVELYQFGLFGDVDRVPTWKGEGASYTQYAVGTATVADVGSVDLCEDDNKQSTETTLVLNSWYTMARKQERRGGRPEGTWIRRTKLPDLLVSQVMRYAARTTARTSSTDLNNGAGIHPPATPIKPTPPPMPTPTFSPASSGGSSTKVKVGDSLKNVFQFKKGKLEVVAPEDDCSEYDTDEFESKAVLTYDPETGEVVWECTEPSEGSGDCKMMITHDGHEVLGVTSDGLLIYGEAVNLVNPLIWFD